MSENDFWKMFDGQLHFKCREKYKAVGTFMGLYYKSKKGKKSLKDVEAEESQKNEIVHLKEKKES